MLVAVVSDTHGQTQNVIRILQRYSLDALFFLGDFYADGEEIQQALPGEVPLFGVAGNGDLFLEPSQKTETEVFLGGKHFFLTHGHTYQVKKSVERVAFVGEKLHADAVLFGHTHIPFLAQNARGMWILNPGSASFPRGIDGPTFALIEWEERQPLHFLMLEVSDGQVLYSSDDLS